MLTDVEAARFWSKVDKSGLAPPHVPQLGECWMWLGKRGTNGYGRFCFRNRVETAHRVSMGIVLGAPVDAGAYVCHRCDNGMCVRPDHLFVGDAVTNMRDMDSKGRRVNAQPSGDCHPARLHPERLARGDRHYSRQRPDRLARGESHGNAKLTEAQVREVRALLAQGMRQRDIAARLGVTQCPIGRIARGIGWAHVR